MRALQAVFLASGSMLLAGCAEVLPPSDAGKPAFVTAGAQPTIGNNSSGFYWLPPMVPEPGPFTGTFDGNRVLEVRVVCLGATGPNCPVVARFHSGGRESARLTVDREKENYQANWRAPATLGLGADGYRLEVVEAGAVIGRADLWVAAAQKNLKAVPTGYIGLVRGKPFLIKFRVETVGQPPADQLPGLPTSPAVTAVPLQTAMPDLASYQTGHPSLPGLPRSITTIRVVVGRSATLANVNAMLATAGARILGGVPGLSGQADALMVLELPTRSHAELDSAVSVISGLPGVVRASPDVMLDGSTAPGTVNSTINWTWEVTPTGDNYGLELMRVPQMWNLNELVRRSGARIPTGVLDVGFFSHPDLIAVNLTPGDTDDHGTHVAGTIGATFDNGIGVDGVSPFANLVLAASVTVGNMVTRLAALIDQQPGIRVINVSLGYNWYRRTPPIDAATDRSAQLIAFVDGADLNLALAFLEGTGRALPYVFSASGNDSNKGFGEQPAQYASPFNSAALIHGVRSIVVVEAVDQQMTRRSSSNLGGHLAAPGNAIGSAIGPNSYGLLSGTSMAAPHLTGLASYLLSLTPAFPGPSRSANPMYDLMNANARPTFGGSSQMVDAFAAALDLDRVIGGDRVLRGLVDIDDGSVDGNLRMRNGAIELSNDLDGDLFVGDGSIDMADFRRFRDGLLQTEGLATLALDGPPSHLKKDLNGDLVVGTPAQENVYPRADFNGDGVLHRSAKRQMRGALAGQDLTDLEVLQTRFADPDYAASDLPGLLDSGDLSIDLTGCEAIPGAALTRSSLRVPGTSAAIANRTRSVGGGELVYTAPASAAYTALVEAYDAQGTLLGSAEKDVTLALGGDEYWTPSCVGLDVSVTFPATVDLTPASFDVLVQLRDPATAPAAPRAGAQVTVTAVGGSVSQASGVTDAAGRFTGTATANAGATVVTLQVTVSIPGVQRTVTASAQVVMVPGGSYQGTYRLDDRFTGNTSIRTYTLFFYTATGRNAGKDCLAVGGFSTSPECLAPDWVGQFGGGTFTGSYTASFRDIDGQMVPFTSNVTATLQGNSMTMTGVTFYGPVSFTGTRIP
jgi:subtilisin family serine protease